MSVPSLSNDASSSLPSTHPPAGRRKLSTFKQALLLLGLIVTLAGLGGSVLASDHPTNAAAASAANVPVTALVQDVPQYLPAGYDSQQQFDQWNGYTCGPATITAILHAYGAKTRIGIIFDLLYYPQFGINDIDQQGLHGPDGFVTLLHKYYSSWYAVSFNGNSTGTLSYARLQQIVEAGYPVAADFWNDGSFWPNLSQGHWMTVVGFTATKVIVRDSSTFHLDNQLSIDLFKRLYTGIAAPVLPVGVPLP
jgi:hypothetical protein